MRLNIPIGILMSLLALLTSAYGDGLNHVDVNVRDTHALQRGAKYFMNYCAGCHSLKYMRYSTLGRGLKLLDFEGRVDKELLQNNLNFTGVNINERILTAMPSNDAKVWFGIVPPDLTLIAKVRGADWLYTFLLSFYYDESNIFHTNNLIYPGVVMPNVLAPLQGRRILSGKASPVLLTVNPGTMSPDDFQAMLKDIVTFLSYTSAPEKMERENIGIFVIFYLLLFLSLVYSLYKVYWNRKSCSN